MSSGVVAAVRPVMVPETSSFQVGARSVVRLGRTVSP